MSLFHNQSPVTDPESEQAQFKPQSRKRLFGDMLRNSEPHVATSSSSSVNAPAQLSIPRAMPLNPRSSSFSANIRAQLSITRAMPLNLPRHITEQKKTSKRKKSVGSVKSLKRAKVAVEVTQNSVTSATGCGVGNGCVVTQLTPKNALAVANSEKVQSMSGMSVSLTVLTADRQIHGINDAAGVVDLYGMSISAPASIEKMRTLAVPTLPSISSLSKVNANNSSNSSSSSTATLNADYSFAVQQSHPRRRSSSSSIWVGLDLPPLALGSASTLTLAQTVAPACLHPENFRYVLGLVSLPHSSHPFAGAFCVSPTAESTAAKPPHFPLPPPNPSRASNPLPTVSTTGTTALRNPSDQAAGLQPAIISITLDSGDDAAVALTTAISPMMHDGATSERIESLSCFKAGLFTYDMVCFALGALHNLIFSTRFALCD